ncbi:S-receptor kinase [Striga asiatica]|uniref:Receptor-like serine/threonine-protein kinase n=1 Tax=Striga asiatica TaxID=4170 RepID=A0A5A7Q8M5_STRAF|nr:S-receptor kinase [Striga asiatica]
MASSAAAPLLLSISITAFFLLSALLFPRPILCGPISVTSISPNFTASYLGFVDSSAPGAFLTSRNNSFQARLTNPKPESASYYFAVVHVISNTIVWSANRNAPISQSGELRLSSRGLSLYNDTGQISWSTPGNLSSVSSLQLLESGNLVLLDFANTTLWQSFDYPTDAIVLGQRLPIGKSLVSSVSDEDLSEGSYRLSLTENDATLQWNGISYWKLSMETKAFRDSYSAVEYMMLNFTGVYLIGDGGMVVFQIIPSEGLKSSSDFVMVKLDRYGVLGIVKVDTMDGSREQYFKAPADNCRIPFVCRSYGVCTNGGSCQCAPGFHPDPRSINGDCVPTNLSLALPAAPCSSISSSNTTKEINYLEMREDLDYFSNDLTDPVMNNMRLSACKGLCSKNCSCLGFFYSMNTSFCYIITDYLGSFLIKSTSSRDANRIGFIKTLENTNSGGKDSSGKKSDFPITAIVLLPSSGVVLIALVGLIIWLRRRRTTKRRIARWAKSPNSISNRAYSLSSADRDDDINFVSIPGLPVRFDYNELAAMTEGFKNQIGSGGFGTVYKGTLSDGTEVAVKKITCLGSRGNKEFLTEIAVIGKIHHINLVRLKGFCAYRGQRFLVYEFMNRGSLDRTLFGGENSERFLEWRERYEIALGTARGLAYLHTGCEHKIIHCDVKPENILLHDEAVKISDFGLSKLLSPEQSGLFTTMRGTRGYLAPEWLTSSAISDKTDVYSYGMVLLEIVRGKKNSCVHYTPADRRPVYFPLFALEMHEEGQYLELLDPRLVGRVRVEEVERVVRVALCCVHEEPNLRPSMSNVVGMLEGGMAPSEPRVESLNFLRFYGRRFTETSRGEEASNEFVVYGSTTSSNSFSYMSSQQVSGPR